MRHLFTFFLVMVLVCFTLQRRVAFLACCRALLTGFSCLCVWIARCGCASFALTPATRSAALFISSRSRSRDVLRAMDIARFALLPTRAYRSGRSRSCRCTLVLGAHARRAARMVCVVVLALRAQAASCARISRWFYRARLVWFASLPQLCAPYGLVCWFIFSAARVADSRVYSLVTRTTRHAALP